MYFSPFSLAWICFLGLSALSIGCETHESNQFEASAPDIPLEYLFEVTKTNREITRLRPAGHPAAGQVVLQQPVAEPE